MAFCKNCGAHVEDGEKFCPDCGKPVEALPAKVEQPEKKASGGPLFLVIYGRAFKTLMGKPLMLWGISLLGSLLTYAAIALCGIPILGLCVAVLFEVSLAVIFLKGYRKEEVHPADLFETFKDWKTAKRVLTGMGWSYLWIFVWSIIPCAGWVLGLIKKCEYSLVPYILVKDPELNAIEAKDRSTELTKGYKWQIFLADILVYAFIFLFNVIVVGLLGVLLARFYVGYLFIVTGVLVDVVVAVLLPLFKGIVSAAFYEEITAKKE